MYIPFNIPRGDGYFFEKGDDYFESWFIASSKNNPIIEKWHFVLKKFWDGRTESVANIT